MPVGLDDCGLQVVGRDYRRHAAEVLQAHAQGEEEVLRALRGDTPDEDVVTVGHAPDEHLRLDHFPRLRVDIWELVAREVHHQLLAGLVGRRQHRGDVLLGNEVLFQVVVELGLAVTVGVCLAVLLPQQLARDVQLAVGELLAEIGKKAQELLHALVGVGRAASMEHALQLGVVNGQQVVHLPSVGLDGLHVAVDRFFVDW